MEEVGRYRVRGRLGSGAFAVVWHAHDSSLDIDVAIKVLAEHHCHDADVVRRFVAEARLLRVLNHPRVVRVHDSGETDGRPYFVMDLADAGSLNQLDDDVPALTRLRLCTEVAEAVQALHEHGQLHRDIKPANVLLSWGRDGERHVALADLGLAKALSEISQVTLTAGSPGFVAPEQVDGSGALGVHSDVYALGALTHATLTGRPPFEAAGLLEVATRHPDLRPDPIASGLGLPSALDDLLLRTLAFRPERRPGSAQEFADELRRIISGDAAERTAAVEHATRVEPAATTRRASFAEETTSRPTPVAPPRRPASPRSPVPLAPVSRPTPAPPARRQDLPGLVVLALVVFLLVGGLTWMAWRLLG